MLTAHCRASLCVLLIATRNEGTAVRTIALTGTPLLLSSFTTLRPTPPVAPVTNTTPPLVKWPGKPLPSTESVTEADLPPFSRAARRDFLAARDRREKGSCGRRGLWKKSSVLTKRPNSHGLMRDGGRGTRAAPRWGVGREITNEVGGGEVDKKRGGRWRGREGVRWEAFRERRNAMEPEEKDGRALWNNKRVDEARFRYYVGVHLWRRV